MAPRVIDDRTFIFFRSQTSKPRKHAAHHKPDAVRHHKTCARHRITFANMIQNIGFFAFISPSNSLSPDVERSGAIR
jgi:hypothetical protein